MKRTTKYVAFGVNQATTEGGQEKAQHPVPQTARLSHPGGMMRDGAQCCTSKLTSSCARRFSLWTLTQVAWRTGSAEASAGIHILRRRTGD